MIVKVSLRLVEAIKLHRTDTTLDLSQKAEKGMRVRWEGAKLLQQKFTVGDLKYGLLSLAVAEDLLTACIQLADSSHSSAQAQCRNP